MKIYLININIQINVRVSHLYNFSIEINTKKVIDILIH